MIQYHGSSPEVVGVSVDYVVFGTGYGATLMLLGWALRTFGPGLRYQDADDAPQGASLMLARLAWRRFASALGAVIATSGVILIFITILVIFVNPGDIAGTRVAWICFGLILLAVAVWAWFFVGRYGSYGILPPPRTSASIFKTPVARTRDVGRSAPVPARPASTPVPSAAGAMQSVAYGSGDEDDAHAFGTAAEDDSYTDEHAARYAKYELHRPDNANDDEYDAYGGLFTPEVNEPLDEQEDVGEVEEPEFDAADAADVQPEVVQHADDADPDVETTSDNDVGHALVEESTDDADPAPEVFVEEDEMTVDDGTDVSPDTEVDAQAADVDDSRPLEDTPEGRAEALRRIQAWQPDDVDERDSS